MDIETTVVILAMVVLGLAVAGWLRTGRYRTEMELAPLPRHLWVLPATPAVGAALALALADRPWPVLLPPLALAAVGLALAAIDADVHRLPNALTLPLIPVELLLLAGASAATGDGVALRRAGVAALLVGGGFVLLALLLYGRSIGMGDAKLMVSIAPVLAWLSWSHLVIGIWLGFVLGGVVALGLLLRKRATKGTQLAFGPYLVAGALLAILFV